MACGVIADDLTGALDGGLQLHRRGFSVSVYHSPGKAELRAERSDIIVLDTESRNVPPQDAVRKTEKMVALLQKNQIPIIYKKIDSTLRGNPGAELEVILRSSNLDAVLLTPALPHTGRTVRNGVLYVDGVPVADTEFASDPHSPIESSTIAEIITRSASFDCKGLDRRSLSAAAKNPAGFLDNWLSRGAKTVFIADAESADDLRRIAELISGCGDRLLPCGSAGLLEHLAACGASFLGERPASRPSRTATRPGRPRPALIVSSSMSAVTRRQTEYVVSRGRVVPIKPDIQDVLRDDSEAYIERVLHALLEGKHVLIDAGGRREELPRGQAQIAEQSAALQAFLSRFVNQMIQRIASDALSGLVVTGGETAINVCASLDASGIRICGELEPLVPAGTLIGGIANGLPIITKAGGFGSDAVFERACGFLS